MTLGEFIIGKQTEILIIPDKYKITVDQTANYILFELPYALDHHCWDLQPPNLLGRRTSLLEFKHYRQNGSKFWSCKPGISLYFAVAKDNIKILQKEGYSYPELKIGKTSFRVNVSGGGGPLWTDHLGANVSCCTNLPKTTLKEISHHALTVQTAEAAGVNLPAPTNHGADEINNALARQTLLPKLTKGQTIVLQTGFSVQGSTEVLFEFRQSSQKLRCSYNGQQVAVSLARVDWSSTAAKNHSIVRTTANLTQTHIHESTR
jgi:hypothetical protein